LAAPVAIVQRAPYDAASFGRHGPEPKTQRKWQDLMLRGMRQASSGWIGKSVMAVVVAFLIGSFAIWGIGDIFRGFGLSTAAKIGRTEITTEQFRQIYNERLQMIGQQIGRPISMDQARALGFDRQILSQVTAEIALDEEARSLRLGLSDAEIARRITSEPAFKGPDGRFDPARFQAMIRQAGYTEQRFVAEQRRNSLRAQLQSAIISGPIVPQAAVAAMDRYQNEQRSVDYVLLDHALAGDVGAPSEQALNQYFEEHKLLFRAPELRKLVLVPLIPSLLADSIEVSDADAKQTYDSQRARYGTPERRQLQQIVFPNADDARAAAERIKQGTSFADLAKERGMSDRDIDLGNLTKAAVIDRAVAEAAFKLKEDETGDPVQGRFGVALVHVGKITPEQIRPFEEVAPEIKKAIATERAKGQISMVYDKIEEARSEGHTLAEVATTLKLQSRSVELDRTGHDPAGAAIADLPEAQKLIAAVFTTDVGVDADPVQVQGGGYVWFEVEGITPPRDRTLDEVKDKVEAGWREEEIATRLRAKAMQLLDKVKGGSSLADAAAADGLTMQTATGLKRGTTFPPFSARAMDKIFRSPKDMPVIADAEQAGDQVVFRVTEIAAPATDMKSAEAKSIADALNRSFSEDVFEQYVAQVKSDIGVNVNQAAIRQVVSGQNPNQGNPVDDSDF
jgi:peptidyl-prolyl cis-trans isomerase D